MQSFSTNRNLLGAGILAAGTLALSAQAGIAREKPNILFILVDDLGYSDVGYMNQKPGLETPNIDKLAQQGMVFTNAYTSSPVCSPTRASLLTGKYPATLKLTCHIPGMGMEKYLKKLNEGKKLKEAYFIDRLPLEEVTLAEALKEQGYRTGFFGKWHLAGEGSQKTNFGVVDAAFHPDKMGFDINVGGCAYGQPASYFSPYKNATIEDGPKGEYLTDRMGDEAIKFMEQNTESPFFLYLSTYTVHTPLRAPGEAIERNDGNTYFAMIETLDENVGRVLTKLDELDLAENTLVVFYADNGGLWGNPPLNGIKGSLLEGGIRVPMIVRWPGKIEAGSSCDEPVTTVDFFPTLVEAAGAVPDRKLGLEGESLVPLMQGEGSLDRKSIYWHFPHHRSTPLAMAAAIRQGEWKLIWEFESEEVHLFNLRTDEGETFNQAKNFPGKVRRMLKDLRKWQKSVDAEMPQPNPEFTVSQ